MEGHAHPVSNGSGHFCVEHKHEFAVPGHSHRWSEGSPRATALTITTTEADELERTVVSLAPDFEVAR